MKEQSQKNGRPENKIGQYDFGSQAKHHLLNILPPFTNPEPDDYMVVLKKM